MKRCRIRVRNTGSIDHYLGYTCANVVHAAKLLLLAMLLEYPTKGTAVADVELNIVAIGSILHNTQTTVLLVYHSDQSTVYSFTGLFSCSSQYCMFATHDRTVNQLLIGREPSKLLFINTSHLMYSCWKKQFLLKNRIRTQYSYKKVVRISYRLRGAQLKVDPTVANS